MPSLRPGRDRVPAISGSRRAVQSRSSVFLTPRRRPVRSARGRAPSHVSGQVSRPPAVAVAALGARPRLRPGEGSRPRDQWFAEGGTEQIERFPNSMTQTCSKRARTRALPRQGPGQPPASSSGRHPGARPSLRPGRDRVPAISGSRRAAQSRPSVFLTLRRRPVEAREDARPPTSGAMSAAGRQ